MLEILFSFLSSFRVYFRTHADIQLEVLALRHQVTVLQRTNPKPKLRPADRRLWVWLSRSWSRWRSALVIVKPATVVEWHRHGFRWYWTWKVRHGRSGRPRVPKETRDLIRMMSRENPLWGAPRSLVLAVGDTMHALRTGRVTSWPLDSVYSHSCSRLCL